MRAAIRQLEAAIAAAQSTYDSAVIQQRSTADVLDLARDLLNAKAGLLNARSDEYLARASLLLAMGKLGLGDPRYTRTQFCAAEARGTRPARNRSARAAERVTGTGALSGALNLVRAIVPHWLFSPAALG